ncbi:DNA polymerase subunit gamma-2, mitochondrial isoform X3 [Oryzias melastigma]|uniref:DNA polymerase subunit gamma-2, mitochondrial isoform X3 n=1 Tax=Oryzias melastigma TaxID=30732 RepID=UPI000CF7FB40|nr:DNA polymerase subunit gamma-2, mitochondrial isoform X3 [Oryzias melastigma]
MRACLHLFKFLSLSRSFTPKMFGFSKQIRSCSSAPTDRSDQLRSFLELCMDRHYVSPGETNSDLFQRGLSCSYGPLGTELRRNLLEQWWHSVTRGRDIGSAQEQRGAHPGDTTAAPKVPNCENKSTDGCLAAVRPVVGAGEQKASLRPGGDGSVLPVFSCFCSAEITQTSLVWFCSPRTSSQWLDHWTRQRLKWWKKFALSPSDFSSIEVPKQELEDAASRGVRILYNFPWGSEALETLWSRGNAELLREHKGARSKLQCRDGQKSVPHVVSISGNMDRGVMAFLSNSLQQLKREEGRQKLQQRKVLKLHPVLAPVKVALNIGRGPAVELRQVCGGLLQEFLEAKIFTWPGYLETVPTSAEQQSAKYDEMGVLFSVVISENTLENGLVQVRSRDTTIRETMHISELRNFLSRYISAAENI